LEIFLEKNQAFVVWGNNLKLSFSLKDRSFSELAYGSVSLSSKNAHCQFSEEKNDSK